ncbi:MAG: Gfo/Idh/MocA family oxidoreductase [Verrucomicrobia bacterium]|nr:Gfo/Idh/MocA family oxidoreductase [Verrucomicrobiota bacterium]
MGGKIRLAVIGVGVHGARHAEVFGAMPDIELVGVADTDEATARAVAAARGTTAVTAYHELLDRVDAVSIAVPASAHYEVARACLERDIHVFLEKPIAETTEQATALIKLVRGRPVVFQVGHVERFNPAITALERIVHRPRFIEAHRLCTYSPRITDVGVVMDLMIHDLEVVLHLVRSPVIAVSAIGVNVLSRTEDIANARLEFANGCIANLTTSRVSPEPLRKIRLFQEDAYISLDYRAQEGLIYRKGNGQIVCEPVPTEKDQPLMLELAAFVECVRRGAAPRVDGEQATRALELALDILADIARRDACLPSGS